MTIQAGDRRGFEIDLMQFEAKICVFVVKKGKCTANQVEIYPAMIRVADGAAVHLGNQAMSAGMVGDLLGNILVALSAEFMLLNLQRGVTKVALGFKIGV